MRAASRLSRSSARWTPLRRGAKISVASSQYLEQPRGGFGDCRVLPGLKHRHMSTSSIEAALWGAEKRLPDLTPDEIAGMDPQTTDAWKGVRLVVNNTDASSDNREDIVGQAFWLEPFADHRVLVVATNSRRAVNQWIAKHVLRPARYRRRVAEHLGVASRVYTSPAADSGTLHDSTSYEGLTSQTISERLGISPVMPVWGAGGREECERYGEDTDSAGVLDYALMLRLSDTESLAARTKRQAERPVVGRAATDRPPSGRRPDWAEPSSWGVAASKSTTSSAPEAGADAGFHGASTSLQWGSHWSTRGAHEGFHQAMRMSTLVRPAPTEGLSRSSVGPDEHEEAADRAQEMATKLSMRGERSWKLQQLGYLWAEQARLRRNSGASGDDGKSGGVAGTSSSSEVSKLPPPPSRPSWLMRGELDRQHEGLLERMALTGSQVIVGMDAEWTPAMPQRVTITSCSNTTSGDDAYTAEHEEDDTPAWSGIALPRQHDAADVIQLSTHNAVLIASLSHMNHRDDPSDPLRLVDPTISSSTPKRHQRRKTAVAQTLPKPRAPSALLEMRSWALRDFVAITGVGVAMDMDKEARAFAGVDSAECSQLAGLDLRWPLKGAGVNRHGRGLQRTAEALTGAIPWKSRLISSSNWARWPLQIHQLRYAALDAYFSRECWYAARAHSFSHLKYGSPPDTTEIQWESSELRPKPLPAGGPWLDLGSDDRR